MSFNEILVETGGFGAFQKILTFGYLALSLVVVSFINWAQVLILMIPPYRFKTSDNDTEWVTTFNESDLQKTDPCRIIQNGENETKINYEVIYDFSLIFPTYSSENNLVCENAWKIYFAYTIYWVGIIFGTLIGGIITDRYGRRRVYQIAVAVTLIADVMTYFCKDYIYFTIFRFCSALGGSSIGTNAFMLVTEHSIPSKRRLNIFVSSFAFALATLAIVWLAFLVFNWRYLLMIAWIPSSMGIIASFFIPESPSWLITKGRVEEALEYIQRMARINRKTVNQDFIIHHLQTTEKTNVERYKMIKTLSQNTEKMDLENGNKNIKSCYQTFITVLNSPNLRKRILYLGMLWMIVCSCYNGSILEFQYLPYNIYITYSIGAVVEIPGMLLVVLTVDRFGRRWMNVGCLITGGIFGILSANIASKTVMLILVMIMRLCYSSAFDITFSYSNEILPTEIRGRVLSVIRTCGGIGSALAPFVISLAQKDALLPLSCFGIFAVLGGLLMLTLPETCHQHLPHTMEEGENYGTEQSFWYCPFIRSYPEKEIKDLKEKTNLESFVNPAYERENQVQCVRFHNLLTD